MRYTRARMHVTQQRAPLLLLSLWLLLGALNLIAIELSWYWTLPWFDLFIHALGGFLLFGTALWLYGRKGVMPAPTTIFFLIFLVALLWEAFEWGSGVTSLEAPGFFFDTVTDIVAVAAGAVLGRTFIS